MLIVVVAFLTSVALTWWVLRCLLTRRVLDIPNGRSSHTAPTPRGGGIGIVAVFLIAVLFLGQRGGIPASLGWALAGGGLLVAGVGLWDDLRQLSPWMRLLIHFTAAGWAVWQIGGMRRLPLGWFGLEVGRGGQGFASLFASFFALFFLVWMINLYNFMDGIDGIAGVESVCASGLGAFLLTQSGLGGLAAIGLALAGASAGFLVWNWPPAKVFMGDVGSGFLGFVFGVLALASANERPVLLWPWLILLCVFLVDSGLTLARRVFAGARWYEAHCSHAYQHAARRYGSHLRVILAVAAINVAWLLPLAWCACVWPSFAPLCAFVAAGPLVWVARHYGAGQDAPAAIAAHSEDQELCLTIGSER